MLFVDTSEAAIIRDEVSQIRERYDAATAKLEERGTNLEIICTQVKKFNANYTEVSQWLEKAEEFQSEQKSIDMDLKSIRVLIKEQKVLEFSVCEFPLQSYCYIVLHFFFGIFLSCFMF